MGLLNYSGRFIPDLATLSEPLRRPTKKDVEFQWGPEQAEAIQKLKNELARAEILGYYDKDAETRVITDASPVGLGAVLAQKQQGEFRNSHCYPPTSETASTSYCARGPCWNCCYETETEDQSMVAWYRQRR